MKNILVLEDNIEINEIISELLKENGYHVFSTFNAVDALNLFKNNTIDCIITDLILPIISGESFIKEIRKVSNVQILIVSAKITLEEKLEGLKVGADDYIFKPFSEDEILLKLNNYFKKQDRSNKFKSLNNGKIKFEDNKCNLIVESTTIELTSIEYFMMKLFFENINKVITREQFVDYLYKNEKYVLNRIVDTHIKNIRRKLSKITNDEYIKTIYGLGYSLVGNLDA